LLDIMTWVQFLTILPPSWYLVWRFWIWGMDRIINQTASFVGVLCSIGLFAQAVWLMKYSYPVALGMVLVPCILVPWFESWREGVLLRYFDDQELQVLYDASLAQPTSVSDRVSLAKGLYRRKRIDAAIDHLTLAIQHSGGGSNLEQTLEVWKREQAYYQKLASEAPRKKSGSNKAA
jgi:hypothetical protein